MKLKTTPTAPAVSDDKFFLYDKHAARLRHMSDIAKLQAQIIPPERPGQPEKVSDILPRVLAKISEVAG